MTGNRTTGDAPDTVTAPGLLQDLVLESADVEDFLAELARHASASLSGPDNTVMCGVTLLRRRKAATVASSCPEAARMDELQYRFDEGPCLAAAREQIIVHVPDLDVESRWPDYVHAVREKGAASILGVPFELEGEAQGALNLYSNTPRGFAPEAVDAAVSYAREVSKALRLAVRIGQLKDAKDNLEAAMQSRTVIDLALGIIMAQNRCSQEAAFTILRSASSSRNVKLRELAGNIVASTSGAEVNTHFEY